MPVPSARPLQPQLAFVVQLHTPLLLPSEAMAGRVEHIASGQAARFASLDELRAFFGRCTELDGSSSASGKKS